PGRVDAHAHHVAGEQLHTPIIRIRELAPRGRRILPANPKPNRISAPRRSLRQWESRRLRNGVVVLALERQSGRQCNGEALAVAISASAIAVAIERIACRTDVR